MLITIITFYEPENNILMTWKKQKTNASCLITDPTHGLPWVGLKSFTNIFCYRKKREGGGQGVMIGIIIRENVYIYGWALNKNYIIML